MLIVSLATWALAGERSLMNTGRAWGRQHLRGPTSTSQSKGISSLSGLLRTRAGPPVGSAWVRTTL